MPLFDHFHPPLVNERRWEGFHGQWAGEIVRRLNLSVLPPEYLSDQRVRLGNRIEVDVATFDQEPETADTNGDGAGGTAVLSRARVYAPPEPLIVESVKIAEEDIFEIRVQRTEGDARMVAAVEIVSEANKDRPSSRRAFVRKCGAYLQAGVSVVVVDVVTNRIANLHELLVEELQLPDAFDWASETRLSAVGYRTVSRDERVHLEVWPFPLTVGAELPTVPLWLAADLAVPLELDVTYTEACRVLRLG